MAADLRALALALPGVAEGVAYGTPIFRVGRAMLARLREDGVGVVKVDIGTRDVLIATEPGAFLLEDHYVGHPLVLVDLGRVKAARLAWVLEVGWRLVAPRRLVRERG